MEFIDSNDNIKDFVDLNDLILQNRIGQGSYSKVYRVKEKKTGEIYAAKILIDEIDDSSSEHMNLFREVNIISKLNHPSILKFKGYSPIDFKKRPRPVIITEYASNGSLEDLILSERQSTNSNLDDTLKLIIIYGIASAMSYLHSHNIIHRDLKPANILIDNFLFPKIADFGLSKVKHSNFESMTFKSVLGEIKGTPIYMSPEIWQKVEYSKASDVYAFSIIVYEIMTNQKPFEGFHFFQIPIQVKEGYRPEFNVYVPDSYKKLITSCWEGESSMRPTFDSILDQLKNDRSFITEKVDEEKYHKYINYINECKVSFDQFKEIDFFKKVSKINEIDNNNFNEYYKMKSNIYPFKEFVKLEERCKNIVLDVGNDPQKLFKIGQYIFEGQELFPQNSQIGLKYLKESMKSGMIEPVIYYCKNLIKGKIIFRDTNKIKKLLENKIKEKDPGTYFYLYGKLYQKENKIDDCINNFKESISFGNIEAMYQCGKILFDNQIDILSGAYYIQKAIENGCIRALFEVGLTFLEEDGEKDQEEEELECQELKGQTLKYQELEDQVLGGLNPVDKELEIQKLEFLELEGQKQVDEELKGEKQVDEELEGNKSEDQELEDEESDDQETFEKGMKYIETAVEKEFKKALYYYGRLHFYGFHEIPIDKEKALQYFKKAAYKGHIESMYVYAMNISSKEESNLFLKKACDAGHLKAMYHYSIILNNGDGIQADHQKAIMYLRIAANEGDADAMFQYGVKLLRGDGIDVDKENAAEYFKKCADKDDVAAMNNYAVTLSDITEDKEEVIKYYKMAIDKGATDAMRNYAYMFLTGEGVQKNIEEAVKYYKMAIDKGDSNAMVDYANVQKRRRNSSQH